MNDFTKEELQILADAINECSEINEWPLKAYAVADKIQSMIDSYCEHELLVTGNESGHGHNWANKCRKCGKIIR